MPINLSGGFKQRLKSNLTPSSPPCWLWVKLKVHFSFPLHHCCCLTLCLLCAGGDLFERVAATDYKLTEEKVQIFMKQIIKGKQWPATHTECWLSRPGVHTRAQHCPPRHQTLQHSLLWQGETVITNCVKCCHGKNFLSEKSIPKLENSLSKFYFISKTLETGILLSNFIFDINPTSQVKLWNQFWIIYISSYQLIQIYYIWRCWILLLKRSKKYFRANHLTKRGLKKKPTNKILIQILKRYIGREECSLQHKNGINEKYS